MDIETVKGRPPFPFATIGVAMAFSSSRLEAVLGEAKILATTLHARLLLIHIGKRTAEKENILHDLQQRLNLDALDTQIIWQEGNPLKTLLEICKQHLVDLLILRAKRREKGFSYYLGSVVRGLSRAAKCSLLLLTEPRASGTSFKKLVVSGVQNPKTLFTIQTVNYFATHVGAAEITVVTESDQQGVAMAMAYDSTANQNTLVKELLSSQEANQLHALVSRCGPCEIKVSEKIIIGRPGYAIRQYAEKEGADLLVINSPDAKYGLIDRIFTHDMEFILENLPCNLLIVHSRVS
jgi:nucleotide-binding universal stress UspA family protein